MKRHLPFSFLPLLVVLFAFTANSHATCNIKKSKDFSREVQQIIDRANGGEKSFQYRLAEMYRTGNCMLKDKSVAAYWYKEAAVNGHAESQYLLGIIYLNGYGIGEDKDLAEYWLEEALKSGHADAGEFLEYLRFVGFDDDC